MPKGITEDILKQFIETQSREQGNFVNLILNYNQKSKGYQCLVYFSIEESAKKAVEFFNRIDINDLKLIAEFIRPHTKKDSNENSPMAAGIKFNFKDDAPKNSEEKKNNIRLLFW